MQAPMSAARCEGLVAGGLGVADPELDRPEPVMRPHAPPQLRRLDDRAGRMKPVDETRRTSPSRRNGSWMPQRGKVRVKIWVRIEWSPVSWPSRKGEFADEREERRDELAQVVADGDRAIRPADPDVDVVRPGVVPEGNPLKLAAQPVVVLGVDDLLVEVARPGVRSP